MHHAEKIDLNDPTYTPNRLLNRVMEELGAKNDAKLALMLECDPSYICHSRRRREPIGAWLMVRIMDRTGWHIQYVRGLAGIPFAEDEWEVRRQQTIEDAKALLAKETRPHNVRHEYNGESKTLADWSEKLGVSYKTLWTRLNLGWPPERVFVPGAARQYRRQQ